MTGLLLKDILVLRKALKTYGMLLLFYLGMSIIGIFQLSIVTAMIQVMIMMLPISAFAYDEQAKWDRYAAALPLSRRTVVQARYLLVLIIAAAAAVFGLIGCVFLTIVSPDEVQETLIVVLVALGIGIFIADILLPISYKLGAERARPYLMAVALVPTVILFIGAQAGLFRGLDLTWIDRLSPPAMLGLISLIPLAALGGMVVSCLISCRIYERKEL